MMVDKVMLEVTQKAAEMISDLVFFSNFQ